MILNLTQHSATAEQIAAGVIDPTPEHAKQIRALLTVDNLPTVDDIDRLVAGLVTIAAGYWARRVQALIRVEHEVGSAGMAPATWLASEADTLDRIRLQVMIGGAPWLMEPLARGLREVGLQPVYAFSRRKSVEVTNEDGTVTKTSVFVHDGFV